MNETYEHKKELTFIGFHTEIAPDEGYKKCPEFWDKEYNEKYARLWQTMKPETPMKYHGISNRIVCTVMINLMKKNCEAIFEALKRRGTPYDKLNIYANKMNKAVTHIL